MFGPRVFVLFISLFFYVALKTTLAKVKSCQDSRADKCVQAKAQHDQVKTKTCECYRRHQETRLLVTWGSSSHPSCAIVHLQSGGCAIGATLNKK